MTIWLLFWLPFVDAGSVTPPTPEPLPIYRRDGSDGGALPPFRRRSD